MNPAGAPEPLPSKASEPAARGYSARWWGVYFASLALFGAGVALVAAAVISATTLLVAAVLLAAGSRLALDTVDGARGHSRGWWAVQVAGLAFAVALAALAALGVLAALTVLLALIVAGAGQRAALDAIDRAHARAVPDRRPFRAPNDWPSSGI